MLRRLVVLALIAAVVGFGVFWVVTIPATVPASALAGTVAGMVTTQNTPKPTTAAINARTTSLCTITDSLSNYPT